MPDVAEPAVRRFDDFLLDSRAGTLMRVWPDGRKTSVEIGSRAFQILCLLVGRHGEIVPQREIMDTVWPNAAVEPSNLTVQLSALRRVLDVDRGQGSCIRNVPGRGYRFVSTVTEVSHSLGDAGTGAWPDHPQEACAAAAGPPAMLPQSRVGRWRGHTSWIVTSCLLVVAALVSVAWYSGRPPLQQAEVAAQAATPSGERSRLSLVVLPFSNMGGDGVSDDSVDAIVDDLTTDLSRVPGFLVIARNSAFTYKGKPIDVKRVGEELGVRYAVEGSVRNAGGSLRINAQLVSTETGTHIWADRFDVGRDFQDTLDDIVRRIAWQLAGHVVDTESARGAHERPANPDAADVLLRARALDRLPRNPQRQAEIVALFERAVELDPMSATAVARLGIAILDTIQGNRDDPGVPEKLHRAEALTARAELMRPDEMTVMVARVTLLVEQGRCQEVTPAAQRTIEAYPNVPGPYFALGICLLRTGRPADAIPKIEQAIRLDPRHPSIFNRYAVMGYAWAFLSQYDEAVRWFHRSLAANPNAGAQYRGNTRAAIAAAQALGGHIEEARQNALEASGLWPMITVRSFPSSIVPNLAIAEQISRIRDGLRLTGVRDHVDEDADLGVPPDDVLHSSYDAPTPTTVPGAHTVRTLELAALMEQRKPLVLDTTPRGRSISGAVGLSGAGVGGSVFDGFQDRLGRKMQQLTQGDRKVPVVTMGWNAERFQGRNLALRLVALGYTDVYWYRGGREAWEVAGLPETQLDVQDW
jgi:TolB-like protein/DNA-binding winged helix-turn-helix (wHTH) protein/tetratricopeptide (TPR) repeat protein